MHLNAGDLSSVLDSDLGARGWDGCKKPYPGMHPKQYAMMSLSNSLIKKFHNDERDRQRDRKALELFTKVNNSCKDYIHDTTTCSTIEAIAIGEAKDFIYRFFFCDDSSGDQTLTLRKIGMGFGVGNGSNIGAKTTSFYSKVANGSMSAASSELHDLYMQAIFFDPTWYRCEINRDTRFGHKIVKSSRLSFVPKSSEISRTICTEPVLNMIFQKGIASCIEQGLSKALGIELSKQPDKNRKLCRIGAETGRFGTIDLSSASDSMSLTLVRNMFPPSVVRWLERTRCETTILPNGDVIDLHMVSSMGNAYTFPLQTLFFSALVYGCYKVHNISMMKPYGERVGNFAVFGDDIIVEKQCYNTMIRLLEICGFTVNVEKSFNTGLFRESCGHDYYQGLNVRGVYIKSLRHAGDFYSAINRLNRWSARHKVALPWTIELLYRSVRFLPVPYDEDDSAGIKVPSSMLKYIKRSKYTGGIHYRYRAPVAYTVQIQDKKTGNMKSGTSISRHIPDWFENQDGLMLSFLHGSIRNGSIGLRSLDARKTVVRSRYSSRWDWIQIDPGESRGFGEDWKVFTWLNLPCE